MSREDKPQEWLTTAEVAALFGLTLASVRTNFPRSYGIRPQHDKWLSSEIELVRLKRTLRNAA